MARYDDVFHTLVNFYRQAPRPMGLRTVGTENELLLVRPDGHMGDALSVIRELVERYGWKPGFDDVNNNLLVSAAHPVYGEVTTDAGLGTLEAVSIPCLTLHELFERETFVKRLLAQIALSKRQHILGIGRQPITEPRLEHWVPKHRYSMLTRKFDERIHAATVCASQQVHVAARTTDELEGLTNIFLAASGIIMALAANSPVFNGKGHPNLMASRQGFWQAFAEPDRVAMPDVSDIEDIVRRLLALAPVFRSDRPGEYDLAKGSFVDITSELPLDSSEFRRNALMHEGTVWWDARPRFGYGTVEIRQPCQQPPGTGVAFAALCLGLAEMWIETSVYLRLFDWSGLQHLRQRTLERGWDAAFGYAVGYLLDAAADGLRKRELGEEKYLVPLFERYEVSMHPGFRQLDVFTERGVQGLIDEFGFTPDRV